MPIRYLLALAAGAILSVFLLLIIVFTSTAPSLHHHVKSGETLNKISQQYGVSVKDLMDWNSLKSDIIQVGQQLTLHKVSGSVTSAIPSQMRSSAPSLRGSTQGLSMPRERPCLAGPQLDGEMEERAMQGSQGLTQNQISNALNPFLSNTHSCFANSGGTYDEPLLLEFNVACSGRVQTVHPVEASGWPNDTVACIQDVLQYAPFPNHALSDGETFLFPISIQ